MKPGAKYGIPTRPTAGRAAGILAICVLAAAIVCKGEEPEMRPNEDFDPAERFAYVRDFDKPIAGRLPFFKGENWEPFWSRATDEIEADARTVPHFRFTDQRDRTFTSEDVRGKVFVANFFFTRCPGICPVTMPNLKKAQKVYDRDPEVLFVSYSITPETDSPAVMRKYGEARGIPPEQWHLLTGDKPVIYRMAREDFNADENTGEFRGEEDFIHSEHAYLLDRESRFRGVYNLKSPAHVKMLIKDIAVLKKEGNT